VIFAHRFSGKKVTRVVLFREASRVRPGYEPDECLVCHQLISRSGNKSRSPCIEPKIERNQIATAFNP
jgi:hypothetical protein